MGNNKTYYHPDDVIELLDKVAEKGGLINELIRQHFANDEETLRMRVDSLEQEFNAAKAKLNLKIEQRQSREAREHEVRKKSEEEIKKKAELELLQKKWRDGEITDEEYWEHFK